MVSPSRIEAAGLPSAAALIGPLGPPQLTCIRSWTGHGLKVVFVHVTEDGFDIPFARHLADVYVRMSTAELLSEQGRGTICRLLEEEGVGGVTAVSYSLAYYLNDLRGRTDWPSGVGVWVQSVEVLDFLESKVAQIDLARSCNLPIAPTAYLRSPKEQESIPFGFPWAVRPDSPADVTPSFKVEFIGCMERWESFRRSRTSLLKPLVIQPYIDGMNIVVHGVRSASTGKVAHSAFEVQHMIDGVTLSLRPTLVPEELLDKCRAFVDLAGIVGVYHFEFRRSSDGDRYYFLEINGRLGGTTGKVYRLGFDEPWSMVLSYSNQEIGCPPTSFGRVASNRLAIVRTIMRACLNRMSVFDYPSMNLGRRLAVLLRGLFVWRDEIVFGACLRSSAIFVLDSVSRRVVSFFDRSN